MHNSWSVGVHINKCKDEGSRKHQVSPLTSPAGFSDLDSSNVTLNLLLLLFLKFQPDLNSLSAG